MKRLISVLVFSTLLFFTFGQLGRISFYNQQVNFYLYEISMILLASCLLFTYKINPLIFFWKKAKLFFAFLAILCLTWLVSLNKFSLFENIVSILYLFRLIFYIFFSGYFWFHYRENKKQIEILKRFMLFMTVFILLVSFIQYFFYPDLSNLYYLGWDQHLSRMFGVFFDTSVSVSIYALLFLLFINLDLKNKILQNFLLVFLAVAVILTFSRSAYIAFILTVFGFYLNKQALRNFWLFLAFIAVLLIIVPKQFGLGVGLNRIFSIESRIKDYAVAIDLWRKYPLTGVGYNRIGYSRKFEETRQNKIKANHGRSSFHSSYMIILVTGGIFGLIFFVLNLAKLIIFHPKAGYLFMFAALMSFSDNILLHPFILFLLGTAYPLLVIHPSGRQQ